MESICDKNYAHIISLGHFCSVAMDIERLGLRDGSYPFDWCISDFEGVISTIENDFSDYLKLEVLSQSTKLPEHYRNDKYYIQFFHDFNKYQTLEE